MNKVAILVSKTLSIILHPLFIPTYAMLLFTRSVSRMADQAFRIDPFAERATGFMVGITFLFTCLLPAVTILILRVFHKIRSVELSDANERFLPYMAALFGYMCWYQTFAWIFRDVPFFLKETTLGSTIAMALVILINLRWKISAHLSAMGGLLGGVIGFALMISIYPLTVFCVVLVISLLLMYARLILNAHTPLQVVAGFLLSLLATAVPNLIVYA